MTNDIPTTPVDMLGSDQLRAAFYLGYRAYIDCAARFDDGRNKAFGKNPFPKHSHEWSAFNSGVRSSCSDDDPGPGDGVNDDF